MLSSLLITACTCIKLQPMTAIFGQDVNTITQIDEPNWADFSFEPMDFAPVSMEDMLSQCMEENTLPQLQTISFTELLADMPPMDDFDHFTSQLPSFQKVTPSEIPSEMALPGTVPTAITEGEVEIEENLL